MSNVPTLLEQMFETALRTKSVKAAKFALEWAEFEEKHKEDICNTTTQSLPN